MPKYTELVVDFRIKTEQVFPFIENFLNFGNN
jgi:hypothetical protein